MTPYETVFPISTRVKIMRSGIYTDRLGVVTARLDMGIRRVRLDDGTLITLHIDFLKESSPLPGKGALVRVTASGRYQAQEGHVLSDNGDGTYTVDLNSGIERQPTFEHYQLEVIEKLPPARSAGKTIMPDNIKVGDKISVTRKSMIGEMESVATVSGYVGKIVPKSHGEYHDFQTRAGTHIFYSSDKDCTVLLLEDIDEDALYKALSNLGPGSVVTFRDDDPDVETNLAIKQTFEDRWKLAGKKDNSPTTISLVGLIRKEGGAFSVLRELPKDS